MKTKNLPAVLLSILAAFFIPQFSSATEVKLTECGTLSQANTTYILQNDVRSDGTCFFFSASGITLDLNGRTITYADMDFDGVKNPGFEEENPNNPLDAPNWDLSGAHGHASRQNYLSKLFFDQHSLKIENVAGDAYPEESVLTSPVYLPLPGKYALTAAVQGGPYGKLSSRLAIEGVNVQCSNSVSGMHLTYAGDMSWGLICEFDIASPSTVRGKIIAGTQDETKNTYLNVDEVDIRPIEDNRGSRSLGMSGVRPDGWNRTMVEIRNGKIIEGRSKAIYSPALQKTCAAKIHDLEIITNGINSSNIKEDSGEMEIYNNYLEANGKFPLNRQYFFSMIELDRTKGGNIIYNNILMNGPHVGINHGNQTAGVINPLWSEIYGNTIKTKITATNGFAINAGSNLDIHDNIIQPFQGHGIGLGRDSDGVKIYNNLIEPRTWPCSEYSSYFYPNSAHGIRIKNYGSGVIDNLEIYENSIIGKTNPQLSNCYTEVSGISNMLADDSNSELPSSNVFIHDNTISMETDNYLQQHAIAYKSYGQGEFYKNTLTSNHIILEMSDSDGGGSTRYKRFESNKLLKGANPQGFYTLRYGYWSPKDNIFTNTILENGADLKNISFGQNGGGISYSEASKLTVKWYLAFDIKDLSSEQPLSSATVSISDKDGNNSQNLTSDSAGKSSLNLKEYDFSCLNNSSKSYQYASPYSITISKNGYKNLTFPISLISSKKITAKLASSSSSENSSFIEETITELPDEPSDATPPSSPSGLNVR